MSAEWKTVVDFATGSPMARTPRRTVIERIFEGYLKAIEFRNCEIRWSYLAALGLKAAP